ncbi:uncharacterized protein [Neodiprion pinetum]|uniref:uncharacterized protein n=1 Tax=Neodiprion pinetum TaxID=441929 RepID=UPI00371920F7
MTSCLSSEAIRDRLQRDNHTFVVITILAFILFRLTCTPKEARMSRPPYKEMPEKVVLEKTGTHVEVTAGPYTKRELRQLLLSSLSLLSGIGDREIELMRLSGLDPDDIRSFKAGQTFGADGKELFDDPDKTSAALRLVELIANEGKRDLENDLADLLRSKGISDDLLKRILTYGLNDETIR